MFELVFTTDESAQLHVHGYDIYVNVEPGTQAVLRIDAKMTGRFPLEAHRFGSATKGPATAAHDHVVLRRTTSLCRAGTPLTVAEPQVVSKGGSKRGAKWRQPWQRDQWMIEPRHP